MCTDSAYGVTFSHPRVFILISHKNQDRDTVSIHSAYFDTGLKAYTRTFENEPSGSTEKRMTDDIFPIALASDIAAEDTATSVVSYPGVDPTCSDTSNPLFVSDRSVRRCPSRHLTGSALGHLWSDPGVGLV